MIKNSPGQAAGFRAGDLIVAADGKPVCDRVELHTRVGLMRIGREVRLDLLRADQPIDSDEARFALAGVVSVIGSAPVAESD